MLAIPRNGRVAAGCIAETTTAPGGAVVEPPRGPAGSGQQGAAELLQGIGLDLADALGRHAVLLGQFLQRGLGLAEEATLQDRAGSGIEALEALAQRVELLLVVVAALVERRGVGVGLLEVGDRRRRRVVVILAGLPTVLGWIGW